MIRDESLVITTPDVANSQLVARVYPVGDLLAGPHRRGPAAGTLTAPIIDNITSTIAPTTWDEVGGPSSIQEFSASQSLVISQTDAMHEQIVELLTALRQARDAQPAPPQPTAMDSLINAVEGISAAWHRGWYESIPRGMMRGPTGRHGRWRITRWPWRVADGKPVTGRATRVTPPGKPATSTRISPPPAMVCRKTADHGQGGKFFA